MRNTFHFLRHGETVKDKTIPAKEWVISDKAKSEFENMAALGEHVVFDVVYSSSEKKAQESAKPFADFVGVEVLVEEGLEEMRRGDKYLSDEEFNSLKQEKLQDRDSKRDGGESSHEALKRFNQAVGKIDSLHENKNILVVSHGTVLSLYFSFIKNDFENIFEYWKNVKFGALGIVKDGKVVKDIAE